VARCATRCTTGKSESETRELILASPLYGNQLLPGVLTLSLINKELEEVEEALKNREVQCAGQRHPQQPCANGSVGGIRCVLRCHCSTHCALRAIDWTGRVGNSSSAGLFDSTRARSAVQDLGMRIFVGVITVSLTAANWWFTSVRLDHAVQQMGVDSTGHY
jgi:hypothetical protein